MKHQNTIEQDVINFIKKYNLLSDTKKILIGFSGGADSVFAIVFFQKYLKKYKITLSAIHINHNLRGKESLSDEKFCRSFCSKNNIEFYSRKVDVIKNADKHKMSIEESARDLRYKLFEKVRKKCNADLIVTAHNNDDNTETVLLNIVTGTGLSGIAGIPVKRGNIIRPFLCVAKEDIIDYLNKKNFRYVIDSSNENLEYRRNYLRKKIIPLLKENINPIVDKVVLQSSEIFRKQTTINEFFTNQTIEKVVSVFDERIEINLAELTKVPEEFLGEIFKRILVTVVKIEFSFKKFESLKKIISNQVGTKVLLSNGFIAVRERGKIVITDKNQKQIKEVQFKIGEEITILNKKISAKLVRNIPLKFIDNNKVEYISADNISNRFILRPWEIGDKIKPLGMKGTKKISDVLSDLKVSSLEKKDKLVLVNDNKIIWLVGLKLNDEYKITTNTKKIVKLCLS